MLLNLRALAHSNMTDMEMSRTTLHFAPHTPKFRRANRDMTTGIASTYLGDIFTEVPEEERGRDEAQPTNHATTYNVRFDN
jgi:hypothetical protein